MLFIIKTFLLTAAELSTVSSSCSFSFTAAPHDGEKNTELTHRFPDAHEYKRTGNFSYLVI